MDKLISKKSHWFNSTVNNVLFTNLTLNQDDFSILVTDGDHCKKMNLYNFMHCQFVSINHSDIVPVLINTVCKFCCLLYYNYL